MMATNERLAAKLGEFANTLSEQLTPALSANGFGYVLVLYNPDNGQHVIRSNVERGAVVRVLEDCVSAAKSPAFVVTS